MRILGEEAEALITFPFFDSEPLAMDLDRHRSLAGELDPKSWRPGFNARNRAQS